MRTKNLNLEFQTSKVINGEHEHEQDPKMINLIFLNKFF